MSSGFNFQKDNIHSRLDLLERAIIDIHWVCADKFHFQAYFGEESSPCDADQIRGPPNGKCFEIEVTTRSCPAGEGTIVARKSFGFH